jgi:hypothetical protein
MRLVREIGRHMRQFNAVKYGKHIARGISSPWDFGGSAILMGMTRASLEGLTLVDGVRLPAQGVHRQHHRAAAHGQRAGFAGQ